MKRGSEKICKVQGLEIPSINGVKLITPPPHAQICHCLTSSVFVFFSTQLSLLKWPLPPPLFSAGASSWRPPHPVTMSAMRVDAKVVMLGKESVGKTSLVERYVHHRFLVGPYQNVSVSCSTSVYPPPPGCLFMFALGEVVVMKTQVFHRLK